VNRQDAEDAEVAKHLGRMEPSTELDEVAYAVIGAAIDVHRLLGPGFLESVYEEALCIELALRGIRFARQLSIGVQY
jgi:PD-(D/E)XK nuclease superfamily